LATLKVDSLLNPAGLPMTCHAYLIPATCLAALLWIAPNSAPGGEVVLYFGCDNCLRLSNDSTEVILCPAAGGRVLVYGLNGQNSLYLDPSEAGWSWRGLPDE
jgi:hypothetical protein